MLTRDVIYQVGGKTLTGYLAAPDDGSKRPGILIFHQGGGLRDHEKERARMLAGLGYVAFAADMYGTVATKMEEAMPLMQELVKNPPLLQERAMGGLAQLKAHAGADTSKLAAIGFCFGGGVVIELSRSSPDFACVVAFHPGMAQLPDKDDRKVYSKVLVCAGQKDPLIPAEAREKFIGLMNAAGADWQLITYGKAGHSFTDKSVDALGIPGFNYHADTDNRSWAAMRQLFDEVLA
ncbi:MAG: dienelactone hydrolase family protein [Proteobacteria bacterium]|nr:dienelactone hydrolase family protein [Pseudomonadota bacterium]